MKPVLFNTEMVRALLDGRKTVTRRVIKPQPEGKPVPMTKSGCWPGYFAIQGTDKVVRPPFLPGDVLWVRETWAHPSEKEILAGAEQNKYLYRADTPAQPCAWDRWRPSIHMPREAARIFLRVTDVRVERLQDISLDPPGPDNQTVREGFKYLCDFIATWNNTIKSADLPVYGWGANPWVWVIEFERIII